MQTNLANSGFFLPQADSSLRAISARPCIDIRRKCGFPKTEILESLVGLFCGATNAPLVAIALSVEMFGSSNLYLFGLVCAICFLLSGNGGLYESRRIQFKKTETSQKEPT